MAVVGMAKTHFLADIKRARKLAEHASTIRRSTMRDDIARSAWMMSVGAADAFYCDAYADFLARTLQAKQLDPSIELSDRLGNLRIPVTAVIRPTASDSWRWRMAARELIEKQTVLDLATIKKLFNHFFRDDNKLFGPRSFDRWLLHPEGARRLFGISKADYRRMSGAEKAVARKAAKSQFEKRFSIIFQRRHDCIHNCDRVKMSLNSSQVQDTIKVGRVIDDIEFLVTRCIDEFQVELREFISGQGFSGTICSRVCR